MTKDYVDNRPTGPQGPTGGLGPTGPTGPVSTATEAFTGVVVPYYGGAEPSGWVWCDGGLYDSTDSAYSALYAVVGSSYNVGGEASGFFRVPNLIDRLPEGRRFNAFASNTSYTAAAVAQLNASVTNEQGHTHTTDLTVWTTPGIVNANLNHGHNQANQVYHEHYGGTDGSGNRNHRNGNANNYINNAAHSGQGHNFAVGRGDGANGNNSNLNHGHNLNSAPTINNSAATNNTHHNDANHNNTHGHTLTPRHHRVGFIIKL